MKADTASEGIFKTALNMSPSIPPLLLVIWSNFSNKIGISSRNILQMVYYIVDIAHPTF